MTAPPPAVAWVSPLPPARSGIADHAAELLPHLAGRLEVAAFSPPGLPRPGPLAGGVRVRPWAELAAPDAGLPVYHLGNDHRFHGAIHREALRRPGVVVLHEVVLHHLLRDETLARGAAEGWVEELRYAYGRSGEEAARRALAAGAPLDPWAHPLFERAVDAARAVVVHNGWAARRVRASRPTARLRVIPLAVDLAAAAAAPEPAAARRRLGLPSDGLLVGTFGHQTPPKRLPVLLAAFARLRAEVPAARLVVVGAADPRVGLDELLASGLGAGVTAVGRVDGLDGFLAWMQAVDVAVNLRWPPAGETSGTEVRLLALGRPLVVSDAGASAEIPDGCAARVPPGEGEEELLAAYLVALARDPGLRRAMGEAACRHAARHHAPDGAAAAYAELAAEVAAGPPAAAAPAAPPAFREDDLAAEVLAGITADAVDLGVTEADGEVLAGLAATLVELGLDDGAPAGGERP